MDKLKAVRKRLSDGTSTDATADAMEAEQLLQVRARSLLCAFSTKGMLCQCACLLYAVSFIT
jgi:hypothetical protein